MNKLILGLAVVSLVVSVGSYFVLSSHPLGQLPNVSTSNAAQFSASFTQSPFTLGPISATTSSATSSLAYPRGLTWGLAAGDNCSVQLSSMTSTAGFSADAFITSISANTSTVVVDFFNGSNANLTINTGTLKATCFHY